MTEKSAIAIVDLGGQYCHLISRRLRDLKVWSDIFPADVPAESLNRYSGVILSGGPRSVWDTNSPSVDPEILKLNVPVLGICYGHQLLAKLLGGKVEPGAKEFGSSKLLLVKPDSLFLDTRPEQTV